MCEEESRVSEGQRTAFVKSAPSVDGLGSFPYQGHVGCGSVPLRSAWRGGGQWQLGSQTEHRELWNQPDCALIGEFGVAHACE